MTVSNKEILYNRWRKILEKKETSDWNPEEKKWAGYLQIPTIKTLKEMHQQPALLPAKQMEKSEHEELIEELRLIKEILQKILNHVRNRL